MGEVIVLSFTAALNPTLVAASTLMLLLPHPRALMLGYLCGAMMMSITAGVAIVLTLNNSSAESTTQHTVSPAIDIALGGILLVLALMIHRGSVERLQQRRHERAKEKNKPPPRWQRTLSKGTPRTTFVIGALLSLPGASYLAGLHSIHELGYSTAGSIALVVGFNIVMMALLEVPLACFIVAPDWTPGAIDRAKAWVGARAWMLAFRGLSIIGGLLILKGVAGLIAG
jgi:Sap, sulfolipid-1-addressing protein